MITNLSLNHIEGVTRAYGRTIDIDGGEGKIHWMLICPKDHTMTSAQASAVAGTMAGALAEAVKFAPVVEAVEEPAATNVVPIKKV